MWASEAAHNTGRGSLAVRPRSGRLGAAQRRAARPEVTWSDGSDDVQRRSLRAPAELQQSR